MPKNEKKRKQKKKIIKTRIPIFELLSAHLVFIHSCKFLWPTCMQFFSRLVDGLTDG